ncbi:uncharacterized protein [Paramormyrops kingsleyae]|uniref:uncharacterized protein isoform X7 n=1 Tax=Paramormyrops kingsleyae TaxID=1676925 RepID=UPI003B96BD8C
MIKIFISDPSSAPFLPGSPDPSSALFPPGSRETSSTLCCPDTPRTFNTRGQLLPSPHTPWPVNFKINWEKMPSEIQSAIANSTRPNPAARRAMIRSVVDQMREHNANPKRGICAQVANDIVRKYPQCFGDVDGDNNVAAASLLQQLKTRIEHLNRNNTMARLRQKRPSISGMRRQERGPMDQYGCVRWQPKELPAGETEESLQEMKRQMLQLYAQFGMAGAEKGEFQRWHENTYMLQRCDLNADPPLSISKIKDDWPFLFSLKGLFSHFSELTGISILEKLPAAIEQRSKTIIEYFEQHKTKAVSEVLDAFQEVNGSKAICIILCLLAHFNENGIFLKADPSAIAADIQEETLPSTPCLIVQDISQSRAEQTKQPQLKSFPQTYQGDRRRCFSKDWYNTHKWLEYSQSKDSAY